MDQKIANPGKRLFSMLAVASVRDVNNQRNREGNTYARKAIIRTGMSLNISGRWEERQLFLKLQQIVKKHRVHFEGAPVVESLTVEEGSGRR